MAMVAVERRQYFHRDVCYSWCRCWNRKRVRCEHCHRLHHLKPTKRLRRTMNFAGKRPETFGHRQRILEQIARYQHVVRLRWNSPDWMQPPARSQLAPQQLSAPAIQWHSGCQLVAVYCQSVRSNWNRSPQHLRLHSRKPHFHWAVVVDLRHRMLRTHFAAHFQSAASTALAGILRTGRKSTDMNCNCMEPNRRDSGWNSRMVRLERDLAANRIRSKESVLYHCRRLHFDCPDCDSPQNCDHFRSNWMPQLQRRPPTLVQRQQLDYAQFQHDCWERFHCIARTVAARCRRTHWNRMHRSSRTVRNYTANIRTVSRERWAESLDRHDSALNSDQLWSVHCTLLAFATIRLCAHGQQSQWKWAQRTPAREQNTREREKNGKKLD